MPREGTETVQNKSHEQAPRMHPMPREGTETPEYCKMFDAHIMHPMPREGTETELRRLVFLTLRQCILCPVRGRKLFAAEDYCYCLVNASYAP